jgi:hypothetical protein
VDGVLIDERSDRTLPEPIQKYAVDVGEDSAQFVIEFTSTGYHQDASMYGGPEHLGWPAEGSDDRKVQKIVLGMWNGTAITMTDEEASCLESFYRDDIYGADLDEMEGEI